MENDTLRVAIVGATGYTGAELLRLLLVHPRVSVEIICGRSHVGEPVSRVLPNFTGRISSVFEAFDPDRVAAKCNVAFCALPHGASAEIVRALRSRGIVTFDLSADFRLKNLEIYRQWYGEHQAPDLIGEACYGLVEFHRDALRTANLIAVPGCYPTATSLALVPLLKEKLIRHEGIVVDAKSGVSGAGRSPTASTHLPEAAGGIRAYKSAGAHRHIPEIEATLSAAAGTDIRITFTPHLAPMTRGILSTCYGDAVNETITAEQCTGAARALYAQSASVVVLDPGAHPDTLWTKGSNRAHLSYAVDPRTRKVIAQATIDNLIKGAAGQAIQCMNVRFDFAESLGLESLAPWP